MCVCVLGSVLWRWSDRDVVTQVSMARPCPQAVLTGSGEIVPVERVVTKREA